MKYKRKILHIIPIMGIVTFIILFIFSALLYPGGSQIDLNSQGFDWINNYWCNLLNEKGMNGQLNPARPYSIVAMIILSLSMLMFFIHFLKVFSKNRIWRRIIYCCSIISMISASLLFTNFHNEMIITSSFFGLFILGEIVRIIYINKLNAFKISGIICIALLILNNIIYYSQFGIGSLPILQKVTLLIVLAYVLGLNNELIKKSLKSTKNK